MRTTGAWNPNQTRGKSSSTLSSYRFYPSKVKSVIEDIVVGMLKDKSYDHHAAQTWTSEIVTQVRSQCRQINMPAYKLIVSAVLGEVKG